jgi:thiamine-phosphate pyrophosphorylase
MTALGPRPLICLVTDRRRIVSPPAGEPAGILHLIELVGAAARAGVNLIQIRERDLDAGPLCRLVSRCLEAAAGTSAKVIVNDRLDVALAARAHGVHLRSDSIPTPSVREIGGSNLLAGRSVHSADEAADISGIDYVIMGTIFPSISKPPERPCRGVDELSRAVRWASAPVLAIGGVTLDRVAEVARAGAAGIAGIGLFCPPPATGLDEHLQSIVRDVRRAFDTRTAVS